MICHCPPSPTNETLRWCDKAEGKRRIGGSHGWVGEATAKLLLSPGTRVIIASKSQKKVDTAVAELAEFGEVSGEVINLTDGTDVKRFIGEADAYWLKVEVTVPAHSGVSLPFPMKRVRTTSVMSPEL